MGQAPAWNLDSVFAGGVEGTSFQGELSALQALLPTLSARASELASLADAPESWESLLADIALGRDRLHQLSSFAHCQSAAHAKHEPSRLAAAAVDELWATFEKAFVPIKAGLHCAEPSTFETFVARERVEAWAPMMRRLRREAEAELPRELQELYVDLEREALHGWGQLYDHISGHLEVELQLPGEEPRTVSMGVLARYRSDSDEKVRKAAYDARTTAWSSQRDLCAMALSNLTGARQTFNQRAGIDELAQTLLANRIDRPVLDAMWAAADHAQPLLHRYMERKAKLLGKERLDWWDQMAPAAEAADARVDWKDATELILDAFGQFSPRLQGLAERAFSEGWIEAEDRPGKRPGGFCAGFPLAGASRIFMTWGDSLDTALTLAHELGHAFHNEVIFDAHTFRRTLTSSLAETASTFAEAVLRDHALQHAASDPVRVLMLDQQLQAGVVFMMNIRARYLFERKLYDLRQRGALSADQLTETMIGCQKEAYGDALATWDPTFWQSKLHFYISHFGFYNWPYAFGYLFSAAVYQRYLEEGAEFVPRYEALLQRTGWDDAPELVSATLGGDLRDPGFWIQATGPLERDLERFLELTD